MDSISSNVVSPKITTFSNNDLIQNVSNQIVVLYTFTSVISCLISSNITKYMLVLDFYTYHNNIIVIIFALGYYRIVCCCQL